MDHQRDSVTGSPEARAQHIQRELDHKRESISRTLAEMKTTMRNEVDSVKTNMHNTLDWREQMHRYPMALALGALALGFFAGRSLGSQAAGYRDDDEIEFESDFEVQPRRSHLISPEVKNRVSSRVEGALSEVADNFLSELVHVGRDIFVPRLMSALTSKIETRIRPGSTTYSPSTSQEHYVGGSMDSQGYRGREF